MLSTQRQKKSDRISAFKKRMDDSVAVMVMLSIVIVASVYVVRLTVIGVHGLSAALSHYPINLFSKDFLLTLIIGVIVTGLVFGVVHSVKTAWQILGYGK